MRSIYITAVSVGGYVEPSVSVLFMLDGRIVARHSYAGWKHALGSLQLDFVNLPIHIGVYPCKQCREDGNTSPVCVSHLPGVK